MFGVLKPGFRSLATLKLVVNVVSELLTGKNSCGIARFPCDSTAFLYFRLCQCHTFFELPYYMIHFLCLLLDASLNISTSHFTNTPSAFEFILQ